ncbi:MAG: metal-dependent hydrolase [Methanobrevibacter sp.]|jgi:L-ascorbate metabolism protein UlaG (beta-lactamase superfamily)|nr:metal-dependent hydrolase [Candidatus Methanoflexus mossambicus]
MEIKWLGHSAFQIISDNGVKLLIDPFISNNPSCNVPVEDFEADYILLTHGHSDHFGDTLEIANRTGATVIGIHEISLFISSNGLNTIGMNIGGTISFNDISITMLEAKHSGSIDFTDDIVDGGVACSYIIKSESGKKVFHGGDTGLFGDMETIIGRIYKPDLALLPIGGKFTMGPFEAALASNWINPGIVVPIHYNTFPAIEQDPSEFSDYVNRLNSEIEVLILNPGEQIDL